MTRRFLLGAAAAVAATAPGLTQPEAGMSPAAKGAASIGAIHRDASSVGGVARAVREGFWSSNSPAAPRSLGQMLRTPSPKSLPRGLRLSTKRAPAAPTLGTSPVKLDGQGGFVELLPEPPDLRADTPFPANPGARYFELAPAPEQVP